MPNLRQYRKKIKSAKNIKKITKTMQMVAASKMKKAQDSAKAGRDYSDGITDFSAILSGKTDSVLHPLMISRDNGAKKELILIIAPEKGLCGSLVTNLKKMIRNSLAGTNYEFVTLGKKARSIALNLPGEIVAEFPLGLSQPSYDMVPSITKFIREKYLSDTSIGKVKVYYSEFINTTTQEPFQKNLLPLNLILNEKESNHELNDNFMLFEPSANEIITSVLEMYLETEIYQVLLESFASEQSARMVAMKNATDNAEVYIEDLTMGYNRQRQAAITSEIADITSGYVVV